MKIIDTIKRSSDNLRQAKARTLLTALALAVGGFTLTITLAAANGARAYTNQLVTTNFNPSSLIVSKDKNLFGPNGAINTKPQPYSSSLVSIGRTGAVIKELNNQDITKLETTPGVASVLIDYRMSAQFVTRINEGKYTGNLEVYNPNQKPDIIAGKVSNALPSGDVLLPNDYLQLLGFSNARSALNHHVIIQVQQIRGKTMDNSYKIVAVTTQPSTSISVTANNILMSTSDIQSLYNYVNGGTIKSDKYVTATVNVKNGQNSANLNKVTKAIEKEGYAVESVKSTETLLNQIITILQTIIIVFGAITLVASFFGVVNTQYISVLQRTREIGLMKALGMSKFNVSRLFIIEATWIGFLGAMIGSLSAVILGTVLNPWISSQINFGSESLLIFNYSQILLLIIFLMAVTTIAGLLPARKAAKLDPIEALRTE